MSNYPGGPAGSCLLVHLMSLVMWLMNLFWELLDELSFPLLCQ